MKVAVVRNRSHEGVINRFGQRCPEVYGKKSVQMTVDALREGGHIVQVMEGDKNLLANLEAFMPPDANGQPIGMVFNMAYGIQGKARYTHVPAMLEMAGVPYTGGGPLGHALSLDKVVTKVLMQDAGVPTPSFKVMNRTDMDETSLRFPLIVKPRHESTSYGLRLVENPQQMQEAVLAVVTQYQQDALVEEFIGGREIGVALLGNEPVEFLPLVEFDFGGRSLKMVTWGDKYHKQPDEPKKICPAPVDEKLAERLRAISLATFRACHCRDYSRVDIRIDAAGNPFVLEINSMASLGPGSAYVMAAKTAGYTFQALVNRILDLAHERYFGTPAPQSKISLPGESKSARKDYPFSKPGVGPPDALPRSDASPPDLPYHVTEFFRERIRRSARARQLKRIIQPSHWESLDTGEWDTSGEQEATVLPGLQHKYPETVLLLVTTQCFAYCRFCFRKRLLGHESSDIATDYAAIAQYLHQHAEVNNALLSGGDPLALKTEQLRDIVNSLLSVPHLTALRFGTRALAYYPARFDDGTLLELFGRILHEGKMPFLITHFDHVDEISQEAEIHIRSLRFAGVQLLNQAVLLKGVNDDTEVLVATFRKLLQLGVQPYYLFQARPVKGATHFQVPFRRGLQIVQALNQRLSGIEKTFRYLMSDAAGKVEILDLDDRSQLYLRYHQNKDPKKIGSVFSRHYREGVCWLDELQDHS